MSKKYSTHLCKECWILIKQWISFLTLPSNTKISNFSQIYKTKLRTRNLEKSALGQVQQHNTTNKEIVWANMSCELNNDIIPWTKISNVLGERKSSRWVHLITITTVKEEFEMVCITFYFGVEGDWPTGSTRAIRSSQMRDSSSTSFCFACDVLIAESRSASTRRSCASRRVCSTVEVWRTRAISLLAL